MNLPPPNPNPGFFRLTQDEIDRLHWAWVVECQKKGELLDIRVPSEYRPKRGKKSA